MELPHAFLGSVINSTIMSEVKGFIEDKKKLEFDADYNNFGITLTFDRDGSYKLRNEITLKIAFWTLFIRFNFSFWKPKKVTFKDTHGNSEVITFKRDLYWLKYISFMAICLAVALYVRYYL